MRILLCDDEGEVRNLYSILLGEYHDIIEAVDGEDGWDKFSQSSDNIDLLILDYYMPKMSGFELIKKIRSNNFKTPVIFITGNFDFDMKKKLSEIDFLLEIFNKPITDIFQLLKAVDKAK